MPPAQPHHYQTANQSETDGGGCEFEPQRFPDERLKHYRQRIADFVPDAVVVARSHFERVTTRRRMRITDGAAIPGIDPILIETFKLIPELNIFRRDKT